MKVGTLHWLDALGRWRGVPFAVLLIAGFALLRALDPAPVETLRLRFFDTLQDIKPRAYDQQPVTIVDIDEESVTELGQWPWPRSLMARLINRLAASGAIVIGVDVLFAEPDRTSPDWIADSLPSLDEATRETLRKLPRNDDLLAGSLHQGKVVLGVAALNANEGGRPLHPIQRAPVLEEGGDPRRSIPGYDGALQTMESIAREAAGHGMITVNKERDDVVRRVPLVMRIDRELVPSLSVEMIRQAIGRSPLVVVRDGWGVAGVRIGPKFVATGDDGRLWLHFTRHQPSRFVSAADVIEGRVEAAKIKGHFVVIGSTLLGLFDFQATPVEPRMPGVEIHAQLIESLLFDHGLVRPAWLGILEIALIVIFGALTTTIVPVLRSALSVAPFALLLVLLFAGAWIAYDQFRVLFDPTVTAVASAAIFTVMLISARVAADLERRRLAAQLEEQRRAAARIEGELSAARTIQLGILPRTFPAFPHRKDFSIYAMVEPASAVGGDLYDFALLDEDHLFFVIGDVSGKGVQAALFMAIAKVLYKSNILRERITLDRVMVDANAEITRENPASMFVTVVAGVLNLLTGELELCNAGHDPPLLIRPGAPITRLAGEGGPPLCTLDDYPYASEFYKLAPGDSLVLLTDGVTEAQNKAQDLYGVARAEAVLAALPAGSDPRVLVEALYADVLKFMAGAPSADDTTILALHYAGAAG